MLHSIKFKMTVVLIVILSGMLLLTYVMNYLFAEDFYIYQEKKNLLNAYNQIEEAIAQGVDSQETEDILEELSAESNISVFTIQMVENTLAIKPNGSNMRDNNIMRGEMYHYLEDIFRYQAFRQWISTQDEDAKAKVVEYLKESDSESDQEVYSLITKGYFITDSDKDPRFNKGLYLFGCSSEEYLLALRIPLSDIKSSARIGRKLVLMIGLFGILIGSIIMFSYASTFTKPIKEIAEVSERMSNLDFDVKVQTTTDDEIGMLGNSINQMSDQLEHAIADLKAANVELMKDIEKKEQIDEMRKDFLNHVSHELKTPIALIQGYAEGLKENINEDEESRDFYCDVISDEAMKMNTMVRKLLNLNQIEFGNNSLEMRRFDLSQLIANKLSASQILFEKKNNKVIFEGDSPEYVWADELMIEEVFSNYLSNALNHVKEEGVIRIWYERGDKNLRLHVFNEGRQIPEEDLDKIWIKFYKVDKARTREYGGSGIGLSLVAATMEAHGKAYGVDNKENGVDFWIDLDRENA